MPIFKVLLTTTQWHSKTIDADTPEQADALAFGDYLNLADWQDQGLGTSEHYETIKIGESIWKRK
jgi:hypothetical protein